ncbi:hypothetical protein BVC80_1787g97 [Macleaya cordata]|uniref:Uncharacterized protein n=1 Tax=Macleaya cordata TaxID=56857 RepID=A0A200QU83_MACCD|nr:hypothetical protein BVC80_1787g97 [Macleaya cordata]
MKMRITETFFPDYIIESMEIVHEDRIEKDLSNDNQNLSEDLHESQLRNDAVCAELDALRVSYEEIRSRFVDMEDNLILIQQQKDEALKHNSSLVKALEEISSERDDLRKQIHEIEVSSREREVELVKQRDDELREKLDLQNKFDVSEERILELEEEKRKRISVFSQGLDSIQSVKECLLRIMERMDEEKSEKIVEEGNQITEELDLDEESKKFLSEIMYVDKLVLMTESRFMEYEQMKRKEKKELENSVVSLTEENRDINSLLRIALVEKEAVEKALNKLRGNSEQKRVALLQFAERGLQRVGFGFMKSTPTGDTSDNSGSNTCGKSDSSECEEETVSLASTVEKIMKNLRLEITQLRRSLEESRSYTERLQSLTEKQAQEIAELTLIIKDLEERETMLAQNVEQLMMEITDAEEEVARWREACELEVEAGKNALEERDREATTLREELNRTKASLDMSNNKLKLKEELATAAMAAQKAMERSLQLADSRAAGLRERIEELTRQLEEAETRGERSTRRRVRHICWPWKALRVNPSGTTRSRNVRRMLPEMESLLHFSI